MRVILLLVFASLAVCDHPHGQTILEAQLLGNIIDGGGLGGLGTSNWGGVGRWSGSFLGGGTIRVRNCRLCPIGTRCTFIRLGMSICRYVGRQACFLPVNPGRCYRHVFPHSHRRFYYDRFRGRCRFFRYSGCGGNLNRFITRRSCRRTCRFGRRFGFNHIL